MRRPLSWLLFAGCWLAGASIVALQRPIGWDLAAVLFFVLGAMWLTRARAQ